MCPTHRSRPTPFCLRRPSAAAQPGAARAQLVLRPIDSGSALEPFRTLPASTPLCLRPTCCSPRGPAWSWSSPNSPRGLHQALDAPPPVEPESSSFGGSPVRPDPIPLAVFGVGASWTAAGRRSTPGGEIPSIRDDFPNIGWVVHSSSTETGAQRPNRCWIRWQGRVLRRRERPRRGVPRGRRSRLQHPSRHVPARSWSCRGCRRRPLRFRRGGASRGG